MSEVAADELEQSVMQFAWWHFDRDAETNTYSYQGVEETIRYIRIIYETQGPFHGIFGFSQGGICAGHILSQQVKCPDETPFNFAFGIFCAATTMTDPKYHQSSSELIAIPSLHIMGEQDELITIERSQMLKSHFFHPQVIVHSGGAQLICRMYISQNVLGHYVPTQKEIRLTWKKFLEEQAARLNLD
jgi:predicted esterase